MKFRARLLLLVLLIPGHVFAEIVVKITAPQFVEIGSILFGGEDPLVSQAQLEALFFTPLKTLEIQASQRINAALTKPLAFAGLADAATLPLLALARPLWDSSRFSLTLGSWVAVQSDSFDLAVLGKRFQVITPDQDYRLGASALPLTLALSVTPFPGEWSWSLGSFGALSQISYVPYALTTWAAGGLASLRWGPPRLEWAGLGWKGLTLSGGGGWVQNRYQTELKVGLPTQVVNADLGFLQEEIRISTSPAIALSLDNRGWFWPLQLSTELTVFRTLRLGVAGGAVLAHGWSSLGIHGTNPVQVTGGPLLTQIIGSTATVTVDGDVSGEVGPWWQWFVGVTPTWAVGAFRIGFPLTWRQPGGISGALAWGISL